MELKQRNTLADLLKGIAVLLMIQVHIVELFATDAISTSHTGKVLLFFGGPLVAPVFMLLLGYFIISSSKNSKQLIAHGIKLFLLGMFLNLALNFNLIIHVCRGALQINVWPYIFGVDILQFAGLATILISLLKKVFEKSILFVITCVIVSAMAGHFLLQLAPENVVLKYVSAFFYGSTWWSYFPLFPWLAYPLAGIAFYQLQQKINIEKIKKTIPFILIMLLFLCFMAATIFYAVHISSNLQAYYHHGSLFALWTCIFIAFYSYFTNEIDSIIGRFAPMKYVKWLGKNVTTLYIIQWVLIGNTATEIYKTVSSPTYLLLYFIVAVTLSSLLTLAFLKLKEKTTSS